jgi:hypothetical protein
MTTRDTPEAALAAALAAIEEAHEMHRQGRPTAVSVAREDAERVLRAALAPQEAKPAEDGDPVQRFLDGIPKDGLPDTLGDHFRVVTVCGHCGEVWSHLFVAAPEGPKP